MGLELLAAQLTTFLATVWFNSRSTRGTWPFSGKTGEVSREFNLKITPADWTFGVVWSTIYLWQVVWIAFYAASYFLLWQDGRPLADGPQVLPDESVYFYMAANVLNCVWLLVWDRRKLVTSVFVIVGIWVSLLGAVGYSYAHLAATESVQTADNRKLIVWLVQNGLGLYAGWLSVAWPLNLSATLAYRFGVGVPRASAFCLYLLSAELLLIFGFDNALVSRGYGVATLTPYVPAVVGLVGSLAKNYNPKTERFLSSLISLVFVLALSLFTLRVSRFLQLDIY